LDYRSNRQLFARTRKNLGLKEGYLWIEGWLGRIHLYRWLIGDAAVAALIGWWLHLQGWDWIVVILAAFGALCIVFIGLVLIVLASRWLRPKFHRKPAVAIQVSVAASEVPYPDLPLKEYVTAVLGTASWVGSTPGQADRLLDLLAQIPQKAALSRLTVWGRRSMGSGFALVGIQDNLEPIPSAYWSNHVIDEIRFLEDQRGRTRTTLYNTADSFEDLHLSRCELLSEGKVGIQIRIGTGAPFEHIRNRIHIRERTIRVGLENGSKSDRITNCDLILDKISGRLENRCPIKIVSGMAINPGAIEYIDFAWHEEAIRGPRPSDPGTIRVTFPINKLSDGYSYLDDQPYDLVLKATCAEAAPHTLRCRLWLDDDGVLKLERY
jgi:hypothetical protein